MKMIEITEEKVNKMSEHVEDILDTTGKLMLCIEKLRHEMYGERGHRDDEYERYRDMDRDMESRMFNKRRMYR